MLIINKKFSDLLNGYKRALELDQNLKTEWETKTKPEFIRRTKDSYSKSMEKYYKEMDEWRAKEISLIAQYEDTGRLKLSEWESNEQFRMASHKELMEQRTAQNQQKQTENWNTNKKWLFISIGSLLCGFGSIFLLILFRNISYLLCFSGLSTQVFFGIAIATLIVFIVKIPIKSIPLSTYQPAPKPVHTQRMVIQCPKLPQEPEDFFNKYSCPNLVERWMEEIQYKDDGKEYFRKFIQDNPEAEKGIPGEVELVNNHYVLDDSSNTVIYIPGLKTNIRGDMDGISISHKGIWILESKYLTGKVIFRDGIWKQFVYMKHSGQHYLDGWEEKKFDKPFRPDDQITTALEKITTIFSKFSQDNPWVTKAINGVIVFTHDEVELDITNCGVPYINKMYLFDLYRNSVDIPELTFEKRLEIADILLLENREIEKHEVSAVQLAEEIYSNSIKSLEKLVNNFGIS